MIAPAFSVSDFVLSLLAPDSVCNLRRLAPMRSNSAKALGSIVVERNSSTILRKQAISARDREALSLDSTTSWESACSVDLVGVVELEGSVVEDPNHPDFRSVDAYPDVVGRSGDELAVVMLISRGRRGKG